MTTRLDHRLFSDQLPSLAMPLDIDMDTDILNMDWLGSLSTKDSLPWDPPAPARSYGYNLAYDYKSDELDEFLNLDQPTAFAIAADSDNYINLEDILSSITPGSDAQSTRRSLSAPNSDLSETAARNNREFQDVPFKSRKRTLFDAPQHIMTAADNVCSPFNINTNIINRRSPSLSTSTDTEPSTPVSTTSSMKSRTNISKKTNALSSSPTRRKRDTAAAAIDDSSDVELDSHDHLKKKKAAHNIIEKRYRTNMNAKFAALGSVLPSATNSSKSSTDRNNKKSGSGSGGGGGCQNKSEILANALTYIHRLQEENASLKGEMLVLKENLLPRGMVRQQQQRQR